MEYHKPMKAFQVIRFCQRNCDGTMESTGKILLSNPAKYEHSCTKCGCKETFDKTYPYIDFKEDIGL